MREVLHAHSGLPIDVRALHYCLARGRHFRVTHEPLAGEPHVCMNLHESGTVEALVTIFVIKTISKPRLVFLSWKHCT